ncbi:MAG: Na+/H+ antiporter NhaA [Flavobacteriales bacterium]|nr:Na+/H+ antiporter NhaA [Flavobacteriales bacterium]
MSIFITLLAFDEEGMIVQAKTAILLSSVAAAMLGALWLMLSLKGSSSADAAPN